MREWRVKDVLFDVGWVDVIEEVTNTFTEVTSSATAASFSSSSGSTFFGISASFFLLSDCSLSFLSSFLSSSLSSSFSSVSCFSVFLLPKDSFKTDVGCAEKPEDEEIVSSAEGINGSVGCSMADSASSSPFSFSFSSSPFSPFSFTFSSSSFTSSSYCCCC